MHYLGVRCSEDFTALLGTFIFQRQARLKHGGFVLRQLLVYRPCLWYLWESGCILIHEVTTPEYHQQPDLLLERLLRWDCCFHLFLPVSSLWSRRFEVYFTFHWKHLSILGLGHFRTWDEKSSMVQNFLKKKPRNPCPLDRVPPRTRDACNYGR